MYVLKYNMHFMLSNKLLYVFAEGIHRLEYFNINLMLTKYHLHCKKCHIMNQSKE